MKDDEYSETMHSRFQTLRRAMLYMIMSRRFLRVFLPDDDMSSYVILSMFLSIFE